MTAPILLTGGTGNLGGLVLTRLLGAGRQVRVLSRGTHEDSDGVDHVSGDLDDGRGIDEAVAGVDTVLHCAGAAKGDEAKASALMVAARRAAVRHVVFISVVGAERVPVESGVDRGMFGYFSAKRAAELVVETSGVPWTILRATQFHDLALTTVAGMSRLPVVPCPAGFRFQPVDAGEVATRLVELALATPAGLVPDLGGPTAYGMDDLLRSYLTAVGKKRLIVPVPLPGRAARAIRGGANLAPEHAVGVRTWPDFLAARVA